MLQIATAGKKTHPSSSQIGLLGILLPQLSYFLGLATFFVLSKKDLYLNKNIKKRMIFVLLIIV
jgi:hypothetical protein